MKSPRHYNPNTGFTLIEVIMVIAIMAIMLGAGLAFSFDSYRGYLFRAEYTGVVHILSSARNQSINNFNESSHGVKFGSDEYVLFEGDSYLPSDPLNKVYPRNSLFTVSGIDTIIFERLTGNVDLAASSCTNNPCDITFTDGGLKSKKVTIHDLGGITQE